MQASFRVLPNDGKQPISRYDRADVQLVLSRAIGNPVLLQDLRFALDRASHGTPVFRLDDHEVIRQVEELVVRGEVVLAPDSVASSTATGLKSYNNDVFGDPVKFSGGKWIALWDITASPTEGELGEVSSGLDRNAASTQATAVFEGPSVAQKMIDTLNSMEEEKKETEKHRQEQDQKVKDAEKELLDAKNREQTATTEEERNNAAADAVNAQAKIEMHKYLRETHEKHLKELKEQGPRAVHVLRLHEQTHLDITVEVARQINLLLTKEASPKKRSLIIDRGIEIADEVNQEMDRQLNPGKFGSEDDKKKLEAWISSTGDPNYRSEITSRVDAISIPDE